MKLIRINVPSNLALLLGTDKIRQTGDVDCYRDNAAGGPLPYRAKVNGLLLRDGDGQVRQFASLDAAIESTERAP